MPARYAPRPPNTQCARPRLVCGLSAYAKQFALRPLTIGMRVIRLCQPVCIASSPSDRRVIRLSHQGYTYSGRLRHTGSDDGTEAAPAGALPVSWFVSSAALVRPVRFSGSLSRPVRGSVRPLATLFLFSTPQARGFCDSCPLPGGGRSRFLIFSVFPEGFPQGSSAALAPLALSVA